MYVVYFIIRVRTHILKCMSVRCRGLFHCEIMQRRMQMGCGCLFLLGRLKDVGCKAVQATLLYIYSKTGGDKHDNDVDDDDDDDTVLRMHRIDCFRIVHPPKRGSYNLEFTRSRVRPVCFNSTYYIYIWSIQDTSL